MGTMPAIFKEGLCDRWQSSCEPLGMLCHRSHQEPTGAARTLKCLSVNKRHDAHHRAVLNPGFPPRQLECLFVTPDLLERHPLPSSLMGLGGAPGGPAPNGSVWSLAAQDIKSSPWHLKKLKTSLRAALDPGSGDGSSTGPSCHGTGRLPRWGPAQLHTQHQ